MGGGGNTLSVLIGLKKKIINFLHQNSVHLERCSPPGDSFVRFTKISLMQRLRVFEDGSFFTIEAAETLCMVCLPPEEHISRKKFR